LEEIDATQEGQTSKITELFPNENSTIGIDGVKSIYNEMDIDNDTEVSKKEILQLFMDNKAIASAPFSNEILEGIQKLNQLTVQSV